MKFFQGMGCQENEERSKAMRELGMTAGGDHVLLAVVRDGRVILCALERIAEGGRDLTIMTDLDKLDLRMSVVDRPAAGV